MNVANVVSSDGMITPLVSDIGAVSTATFHSSASRRCGGTSRPAAWNSLLWFARSTA